MLTLYNIAAFDWITIGMGNSPKSLFYPAVDMDVKAKHPVILVPGLLSSKLESWSVVKNTCEKYPGEFFRASIYSKISGVAKWIFSGPCVLDIADLDPEEGRDSPKGYKVRPGAGFQSIDYFAGTSPIFAKIIGNLGAIGYDPGNMAVVSYDWRLSFEMMESRDYTLSRMKMEIELLVRKNKEKAVIMAHSLGGLMTHYFIHWVTNIDPEWMNTYIHAWIPNSAPFLGSPESVLSVTTGYVKDASLDSRVNADARQKMRSHIRSYYSMFPMGGNRVWGNGTFNPALKDQNTLVNGQLFTLSGTDSTIITADKVTGPLLSKLHPALQDHAASFNYKATDPIDTTDKKSWINPLASKLPNGTYTVYCSYGIGSPTVYSFAIKDNGNRFDWDKKDSFGYHNGAATVNGDATVTLTSLGYPCHSTWKSKRNNPYSVPIITKEYPGRTHGGILQDIEFLSDLLMIASGHEIEQVIHSNITAIAAQIDRQ